MFGQQNMRYCLQRFEHESREKNTRRTRRSSKTMIPCEKTITHAIDDGNEKRTSACEERFRFL